MTVRLLLAAAASAAALWLIPASVHIVDWTETGPVRIALLPPMSRLLASVALVAIVFATVLVVWRRSGRPLDALAVHLTPLVLLGIWIVPFLPWLPDRAPALLVIAGPMRWTILVAVIAAIAAGAWPSKGLFARAAIPRRAILAIGLLVYLAAGLRSASATGFTGDEPHYLVIAHSLVADRDLDIANNHAAGDYHAFYPGDLGPDFLRRGRGGQIYSIHAPGLPVLIAPAYAVAGATGAVVFMAILASLTSLAIFDAAAFMADRTVASVVWAATCLTVPLVPHAWLIYPELPAALVAAWVVCWWQRPAAPAVRTAIHGTAIGALPWLHTKFVVLVPVFLIVYAMQLWPRRRLIAALSTPVVISGCFWLASFYWMYGTFDPQAPYGSSAQATMSLANVPRGVMGLLFDPKFGLLIFSPVYALAGAGAASMLSDRRQRTLALGLIVSIAVFVASTTRFYMWWAGASAPARFLVPIVPLLAPFLTAVAVRLRGPVSRGLIASLGAASVAAAAIAVSSPDSRLLFSPPHGTSRWLEAAQGGAPLTTMWPTFTEGPWWPQTLQLMPWVAAFGLCAAIALWMARVGRIRLPFWGAAVTILGGYAIGACLVSVRAPEDRARVVRAGKLAVMERFDPTSTRGVAIAGMNRLTDNETLAATTVSEQRSQSIDGAATRRSDWRFALPAGRYDVRVWLDRSEAREGDVTVELGRGVEIAHASASAADPVVLSAELVVSGPIELTSPVAAVQRAIRRVDVTPAAIVPASVRPPFTARSVEPLAESGQAYLAYVDDNTYPEGGTFWTKSTNRGTVVVARAGRTAMRLVLHVGPGGGAVDVDAGSWHWRGDFEPNATRELDVPLPAGDVVPLSVRASRAFVPARVDSGSADWRRLGCQVRVLLQ